MGSDTDTSTNIAFGAEMPVPTPHGLAIGDIIIDSIGREFKIARVAKGGWLTEDNLYVSRNDLAAKIYGYVAAPVLQTIAPVINVPTTLTTTPHTDIPAEWLLPENIDDIAQMLAGCETPEELAGIRAACPYIEVLRMACKDLDANKVTQIKQWVLEFNDLAEF